MAKKRHVRILPLILCLIVVLSGCGKSTAGKDKSKDSGSSDSSVSGKGESGTSGQSGAGEDADEDGEDKQAAKVRREYEAVIEDRSKIEGKLAAYFVGGSFNYTDNTETTSKDVVGGESTLLVAPDGKTMLIDFNSDTGNAGYLVKLLKGLGIQKIDCAVVTAVNAAHLGGFLAVNASVPVGEIYMGPHDFSGNIYYDRVMSAAKAGGIPVKRVSSGATIPFGAGVTVDVLSPDAGYSEWGSAEGVMNGSLVLKVTYAQSSFLIGGDISSATEASLIARHGAALKADVVRMNRQGAKDSNSKEWISAVAPKIAVGVVSSAADDSAIARYFLVAKTVLHTSVDGACLIYTSGDGAYDVQVEMKRKNNAYGTLRTEEGHMTVN